jgi:hypothetical protein
MRKVDEQLLRSDGDNYLNAQPTIEKDSCLFDTM